MDAVRFVVNTVLIAGISLLVGCGELAQATRDDTPTDRIRGAATIGLDPQITDGPFESIDAYCKQVRKEREHARCGDAVRSVDQPEDPYLDVEMLQIRRPRDGLTYCELAVQIDAGVYVTKKLFICGEDDSDVDMEVLGLEQVWQRDTAPIVRAELRTTVTDKDAVLTSEELALCGVGDSGEVSCTRSFQRLEHVLHDDGDEEHRAASMTLSRFGVIKINGDGLVDGKKRDITGAYRLSFP